jgi:two-component system LytT family sensor kinase
MKEAQWLALIAIVVLIAGVVRFAFRGQRRLGTPIQRAAHSALHTANLAAPALRTGLNKNAAERSIGYLRDLLGTRGVLIADVDGILASEGIDPSTARSLLAPIQAALGAGRPRVVTTDDLVCRDPNFCELQTGVMVPLTTDGNIVGVLAVLDSRRPRPVCSASVARWLSSYRRSSSWPSSTARAGAPCRPSFASCARRSHRTSSTTH